MPVRLYASCFGNPVIARQLPIACCLLPIAYCPLSIITVPKQPKTPHLFTYKTSQIMHGTHKLGSITHFIIIPAYCFYQLDISQA
jgi:hypothetical protein